MTIKVFPTVGDVGGNGSGKTLTESNLIAWLKQLIAQNFVISGFTVPSSSANLTLSVAVGQACIDGRRVDIDTATTVTCTANATNHIYLKLTKDASQNVTGAVFEVNTTGTAPADSVKIATAVTSGTAVTSTTDARVLYPFAYAQMPYVPVNKAGDEVTGVLIANNSGNSIGNGVIGDEKPFPTGTDLNSFTTPGVYHAVWNTSMTNEPVNGGTSGRRVTLTVQKSGSHIQQFLKYENGLYYGKFFYRNYDGAWGAWLELYHSGNDGAGSGLDADMVDGKHAINLLSDTNLAQDINSSGKLQGVLTTLNRLIHSNATEQSFTNTAFADIKTYSFTKTAAHKMLGVSFDGHSSSSVSGEYASARILINGVEKQLYSGIGTGTNFATYLTYSASIDMSGYLDGTAITFALQGKTDNAAYAGYLRNLTIKTNDLIDLVRM